MTAQSVHFVAALDEAQTRAQRTFPAESKRIARGMQIVRDGGVTFNPLQRKAYVRSQSSRRTYTVSRETCECVDHSRAPGGRCKHWWAMMLYRKALQILSTSYHATVYQDCIVLGGNLLIGELDPTTPADDWKRVARPPYKDTKSTRVTCQYPSCSDIVYNYGYCYFHRSVPLS